MTTEAPPASNVTLWTGILGTPVLWILHQQVSYLLVRWACANGRMFVLHLVSAAFLFLAALVLASAMRSWRRLHPREHDLMETVPHRRNFMAVLGVAVSAVFTLAIVLQWIPNLLLDPCHR
jgi:hypothetical protein